MNITQYREFMPDGNDLSGAAAALLRLQDTYRLKTSSIASGQIEGTWTTPQLSGELIVLIQNTDCSKGVFFFLLFTYCYEEMNPNSVYMVFIFYQTLYGCVSIYRCVLAKRLILLNRYRYSSTI